MKMIDIPKGRYWGEPLSLVDGCTPVSAACDNCWLRSIGQRFDKDFSKVTFRGDRLQKLTRATKPNVWAVWSDLMHKDITDTEIEQCFNAFNAKPDHTILLLTKRIARASEIIKAIGIPKNVWLGTTVENKEAVYERIPILTSINHPQLFISAEPLLDSFYISSEYMQYIGAIICGGESGIGARQMPIRAAISLKNECWDNNVPFFFKQNTGGVKKAGRLLVDKECNDLAWGKE